MGEDFLFPSQDFALTSSQENEFENIWKSYSRMEMFNIANDIQLDSSTIENESNQALVPLLENAVPEESQANIQEVNPPVEMPTPSSTVGPNVHQGTSSLPACETWPGAYDFTVSFSPQLKSTKGVAWTYSKITDKLYVGKDVPCPVNFSANTELPNDTFIRVMALYTSPEQVAEVVRRCYNHSDEEFKQGRIEARHLIRCESSTATYHEDAITGRHSVLVPFENPSAGQQYSTYILKFACFGSCTGGPNRRPLMLIFTLERNNQVIGRKKLDVKICACPGRDKKSDEDQHLGNEMPLCLPMPHKRKLTSQPPILSDIMDFTKNVYLPQPKKSKHTPNNDGLYVVKTPDVECYNFLKQMKKFFDLCKVMKGVHPDTLSKALHRVKKIKTEDSE